MCTHQRAHISRLHAQVVGSKFGRFEAELENRIKGEGRKYGTIIVTAETQKGRKGDKVRNTESLWYCVNNHIFNSARMM